MMISLIAIVMGSILVLALKSLKKILVYIIVTKVGYRVGGLWLVNRIGIAGSILHLSLKSVISNPS